MEEQVADYMMEFMELPNGPLTLYERNSRTIPLWPFATAHNTTVLPCRSAASGSGPCLRVILTVSSSPFSAINSNSIRSASSFESMLNPFNAVTCVDLVRDQLFY